MPKNAIDVAIGGKRTWLFATHMSAFDPNRTSLIAPHMSAFGGKADIKSSGLPAA